MKKGLLGLVLALSLVACGDKAETSKENTKPVVKIGVVFQLTGEATELNNNILHALQYTFNKKNNSSLEYKLITEDSAGNPIKGISAAKKLKYVDDVDVLILSMVNVSKAVAKEMKGQDVSLFAIVPDTSIANGENAFTFYAVNDNFIKKTVSKLNEGDYKNIAMVVSNYVNAEKYAEGIEKNYTSSNITKYSIQSGVRDFRGVIEKIKNQNHDLILMIVRMPESDILMKQFKEANVTTPMLGVEYFVFSNHKELYENIPFIDSAIGDRSILDDIMQQLNINNEFGLIYAHDLANLIITTYESLYTKNKTKPTNSEVISHLHNMNEYLGAMGKYTVTKNGNFGSGAVIKKIINGQPVVVEE